MGNSVAVYVELKNMKKVFKMFIYILLGVFLVAIIGGLFVWREFGANPTNDEISEYKKLSYYKNTTFQSPEPLVFDFNNVRNGKVGFIRFLTQSSFAPQKPLPKINLTKESFAKIPADFAIYWLGHSNAIMELEGKRIIFDPVFANAAPIPVAVPRYGKAPIARKDLPAIDYIVITHAHYDHLERKTVQTIKTGHFIVPLGVGAMLRGWGVDNNRITELGWEDAFEKDGLKIIAVEAVHYSNRSPWNRNETLWNSYAILGRDIKIFWGGDTGYGQHFKRIGQKYGPFDFAALEIDGWNTGWKNTHLFPNEVIKATQEIGARKLLPIHWAVFDLALHPWNESIEMVLDEAKNTDIKILTPKMGEKIDSDFQTNKWW